MKQKVLIFTVPKGCRKPKVQGSARVPMSVWEQVQWSKRGGKVFIVACDSAANGRAIIAGHKAAGTLDGLSCESCGFPQVFVIGAAAHECAAAHDSMFAHLPGNAPVPAAAFRSIKLEGGAS